MGSRFFSTRATLSKRASEIGLRTARHERIRRSIDATLNWSENMEISPRRFSDRRHRYDLNLKLATEKGQESVLKAKRGRRRFVQSMEAKSFFLSKRRSISPLELVHFIWNKPQRITNIRYSICSVIRCSTEETCVRNRVVASSCFAF